MTRRCLFGAHLAVVFITTAIIFSVSDAVTVTFVNSSYVYADSQYYRVELSHPNLTMYYRDRRGNIPGDKVVISFDSYVEQFRWGPTPNASGSVDTAGDVCTDAFSRGEYVFNYVTWTQGPEGSVILQANYSFGPVGTNCSVVRQYYVTDKSATINVAGRNVTFTPQEVKISVIMVCPWRQQLERLIPGGPTDPIYLRTRLSRFRFNLDIYFSSAFASYPIPIVSPENLTIPSDWYTFARDQCAFATNFSSNGELPQAGRRLQPDFNFTESAGILVQNENFFTGLLFLLWARSDYRQFTRASARADDSFVQFNTQSNYLSLKGNVSFEFYNILEYDPTLQLLFTGNDAGVDNPPQAETPQTIALNSENMSAGVVAAIAVPIVVVVAAAVILIAVVVTSRQRDAEKQILSRRLKQGQDAIKGDTRSASKDPEAPPAKSSKKGWVKSEKPSTN
eukprot:TRINITY_DN257_c0_g1_i2.p1 TRINITY_DN257_c0_g1~~TRINITY_DN257_c0_g1_i2.p1  ORF type:complete len:451 (+),score=35.53 TRINITY_DN257_c0_g1_i2:219-1571(+)